MRDKNVLVLGMGRTGLSMAKWLSRLGAHVRAADSRAAPPCLTEFEQVLPVSEIFTGGFPDTFFSGIDLIAISPGVPMAQRLVREAAERGISIVGDIELFSLASKRAGVPKPNAKILAVTGSNGKTTVTSMVGAMVAQAGLDVEVAGNIGPAVLDALTQREASGKLPQVWVLEVSSFQLEATRNLDADAAAVLNVSEDHFDRYAGMQHYSAAKARIFLADGNSSGGIQVLNRDDARVYAMALKGRKKITFGLDEPVAENEFGLVRGNADLWLAQGKKRLLRVSELGVSGLHNASNALAALALCRAVDLPFEPLLRALREFKGLAHRVEKVAVLHGITFYDDSKGTNVGATVAALNGMAKRVVLIAGGDGKGQNFSPLEQPVADRARAVVLIGRDAERIAAAIRGSSVPLHYAKTMVEAVRISFSLAREGDAVLMSPACASLDMFNDYVHRAEVFVGAVQDMQIEISGKNVTSSADGLSASN